MSFRCHQCCPRSRPAMRSSSRQSGNTDVSEKLKVLEKLGREIDALGKLPGPDWSVPVPQRAEFRRLASELIEIAKAEGIWDDIKLKIQASNPAYNTKD